jgi:rhodanese-related sulfurtransferase
MALFFEFIAQQWLLAGALLVVMYLLFTHESRKGGRSISPHELTTLVNQQEAVVVDVRDASDFRSGHIVNALNISSVNFAKNMGSLEKYKEKPVIVVCKLGQHAGPVTKLLKENGYTQVYRLGGGIAEWKNSQMPVVQE